MADLFSGSLGLTGLFFSAFLSATVAPGGSEVVLAYLLNQPDAAVIKLIAIASVGNTLGAFTTWGLGIWTSKKYPADKLLNEKHQKALNLLHNWGGWALLFSWVPIIGDGLCFAGGWLRLSIWSSSIAILTGKTIRYSVVAFAFL
jgi:membrane protein YqaA with SNARE-associated domain